MLSNLLLVVIVAAIILFALGGTLIKNNCTKRAGWCPGCSDQHPMDSPYKDRCTKQSGSMGWCVPCHVNH